MPKVSEEHSEARRRQIVDAAYRCFARKGFHQTSMRDIYEEAGLSAGAIYHYFAGKADIIEASFLFDLQRSLSVLGDASTATDPLKALDDWLEFFYAGLESAAELDALRVNVQAWGEALVNPRLLAPLASMAARFRESLGALIRRAQAEGTVDPHLDPEAAGAVIFSSFLGLYLQKAVTPELDVAPYKAAMLRAAARYVSSAPAATLGHERHLPVENEPNEELVI